MPKKTALSQAAVPTRATKKLEFTTAAYQVGDKWVDGGFEWWVEATVEDGGLVDVKLNGASTGDNKPVKDDPSYLADRYKILLKRLYENDGKV